MALLDTSRLETLTPSQFFTFTLSNPLQHDCYLRSPLLRFAVLDSPNPPSFAILAAMVVPAHRESDWIFSTESGQRYLLLPHSHVSRLVLIGNDPPLDQRTSIYVRPPSTPTADRDRRKLESELKPLVIPLHPTACFQNGVPLPQFLWYEDSIVFCSTLGTFSGPVVGDFRVEDVEIETKPGSKKDFRRRMRFKRMPYLIQTEVPLTPAAIPGGGGGLGNLNLDLPTLKNMNQVELKHEASVLVPRYLKAMVSTIFLIAYELDLRKRIQVVPRVLCLGVGGGALLSFFNTHMRFKVVGVDCDDLVLEAARNLFGLKDDGNSMELIRSDAAEWIKKAASDIRGQVGLYMFDVLMVDLDASDGIYAPPNNFATEPVFRDARSVLSNHGVFVMNVVPLSQAFYLKLIGELKRVFPKVYKIDVHNGKNMVLAATLSPPASHDRNNTVSQDLRQVISAEYIRSIKEV